MTIHLPICCKHFDPELNDCNRNKHKAEVGGCYWVYPCRLLYEPDCSDFAPKSKK